MSGFWDAETVNELRGLQAGGLSAAEIADCMGCTRNAVIGKLHRLRIRGIPADEKKRLLDEIMREIEA